MKVSTAVVLGAAADSTVRRAAAGHTLGMDVSGHQGSVDWAAAWNAGARFAYTKAGLALHFQLERSVGKLRRLYDRREK